MTFIKWYEITSFHNVRKLIAQYPELLQENNVVTYRSKVKLHGTNAAVQVLNDGTIAAQSRANIITPQDDNAGFATWVYSQQKLWSSLSTEQTDLIIFGEWCGPNIQKNVAISQIPAKIFAVFAMLKTDFSTNELGQVEFINDPQVIAQLVKDIPGAYVLPWYESQGSIFEIKIDWTASSEELKIEAELINDQVALVERCDPWVKANFNVEGIGEGLVFYPISHPGERAFSNLAFKAKGEEHKNIKTQAPAQVDPEVAASIAEFAELVLTEARLEQGVRAVGGGELIFDTKRTGQFIGWVCQDVEKETSTELEASGLTWKQVQKAVGDATRKWYLNKAKC